MSEGQETLDRVFAQDRPARVPGPVPASRDVPIHSSSSGFLTSVQDVGFGFRQLVDVAVRALSPGINDPTTAVHVIGRLSDLLCRLTERNPGLGHLTDDDERIRVVLCLSTLPDLLDMAMDQPRKYGAADPAVTSRLLGLLHQLAWCDRKSQYRPEILDQLEQMRIAIPAADYSDPQLRSLLKNADPQGLAQA